MMRSSLALALLLIFACEDEEAPVPHTQPPPSVPRAVPSEAPEVAATEAPTGATHDAPTTGARTDVDQLEFGPNRAAYDRSGRPPTRVPRRPDESYTADPYEFHYEDVPGLDGVRAPTNHVTLVLQAGLGRDVAERIAAAEGGEIVGQIPESQWYDLRLTTTTFDDVAAAVERIRPMAGVEIVGFVGEAHVARGREALATE